MLKSGQRVRFKTKDEMFMPAGGVCCELWGVIVEGPYRSEIYLVEVDEALRGVGDPDGLVEITEREVTLCVGDELGARGQRCHCDLCRTIDCGHVAGRFDLDCPECRMPVQP